MTGTEEFRLLVDLGSKANTPSSGRSKEGQYPNILKAIRSYIHRDELNG